MKAIVTGANGQLGYDVIRELCNRDYVVVATARDKSKINLNGINNISKLSMENLDISNESEVASLIEAVKPDAVINCAAWTAVDAAEDEENKPLVEKVNVLGSRNLAKACKVNDAKLVHISTDYVYDGQGDKPWDPNAKTNNPVNYYGKTKLEGEHEIRSIMDKYFVVRISWAYGENGSNFVKTMLKLGKKYNELKVVSDQIGTPTYTFDLARLLVDMAESKQYGTYNASNEGTYISWYEFAKAIFEIGASLGVKEYSSENLTVNPVTTEEYGVSKAKRPFNSRLDKSKLVENGFKLLPDWKDSLNNFIKKVI